ncbi:MAG: hypothetical protein ACREVD_02015, partial [Burkholderiales bacterium]
MALVRSTIDAAATIATLLASVLLFGGRPDAACLILALLVFAMTFPASPERDTAGPLRLARDILDLDEFRELALPGGLAKRGRPAPTTPVPPDRKPRARRKEPSAAPGEVRSPRGQRIRYEEVPFDSSLAHSRFVDGVVQA